jgi:uncharacterized membrane protein
MIEQLLHTWQDPHSRHALLVHFPVALCALGVLPLIALAMTGFKSYNLKIVCLAWFAIASLGAFLAGQAGQAARPDVQAATPPLTAAQADLLHDHQELGEKGWMWPLIPGGLVAITFIDRRGTRNAAGALAIIASIGVGGVIGYTAHLGGQLVYVHGLGVPQRAPVP